MTDIHICITDSFFQYPELNFKGICLICQQETIIENSYIGSKCQKCGAVYDITEMWMGSIAKYRREKMKLTRKQIAELYGKKPATIKKYEYCKCKTAYYEFTAKLIKERSE